MFGSLARKIFGSSSERIIKSFYSVVTAVNALEPSLEKLSDDELRSRTQWFRDRLKEGETLEDILPEAFATVREASRRTLGLRHFDVQLIGGLALHRGMISEMRTGEGKTLVATLPAYLNALEGKGVHVVTVNDYLAKRDAETLSKLYNFLGLSVGVIVHGLYDIERKEAYAADITYGTNNEYGFDYLRDNMKFMAEQLVQRPFNFALVDEVDSILIDEARTPLIISGPTEDNSDLYIKIDKLIPLLAKEDYEIDEKARTVVLTDEGTEHVEQILKEKGLLSAEHSLYDIESISLVHHVNQALRAHKLFACDTDYIVKDGKVVIIDEFTGRMMDGRRYSEGLHQALEAKENVQIQNENQTLASITFQNYFRLYPKLAGMTGTAKTEEQEFRDIYNLGVLDIPTHMPVRREDEEDAIYRSAAEKYDAIIAEIEERHKANQPILVGTASIEKSEFLSNLLKKKKIQHNVLNARHHEREAHIIAQAGRPGAITIATNMAGRGTDIMLGGNAEMRILDELGENPDQTQAQAIRDEVLRDKEKVLAAGGLYVIGSERHESRRIDNQLRGRSGRQGDPGRTKFFLSLEDDLMRIFGSDRLKGIFSKSLEEGEAIRHPWISRALEKAQEKVEARNYDIRKNLLKFDNVMNDQRKVIYEQRLELMQDDDISDMVAAMYEELNEAVVDTHIPARSFVEQWDVESMQKEFFRIYGISLPIEQWAKEELIDSALMLERIQDAVSNHFKNKEASYGAELIRLAEKRIVLITLDQLWKDHLLSLDHLRQGINLRAYGQKDPLNEYKHEAFAMFENMLGELKQIVVSRLAHLEINNNPEDGPGLSFPEPKQTMFESRQDPALLPEEEQEPQGMIINTVRSNIAPEDRDPRDPNSWGKVGRNDDCPCGSGKKYKHCHGQI